VKIKKKALPLVAEMDLVFADKGIQEKKWAVQASKFIRCTKPSSSEKEFDGYTDNLLVKFTRSHIQSRRRWSIKDGLTLPREGNDCTFHILLLSLTILIANHKL